MAPIETCRPSRYRQRPARLDAWFPIRNLVRVNHPGLEVTTAAKHGRAAEELTSAANDAEVMVLGSRSLGRAAGSRWSPLLAGR